MAGRFLLSGLLLVKQKKVDHAPSGNSVYLRQICRIKRFGLPREDVSIIGYVNEYGDVKLRRDDRLGARARLTRHSLVPPKYREDPATTHIER